MKTSSKIVANILAITIVGTSAVALANHKGHDCHGDDAVELIQKAKLSVDQAMAIALTDVPGKVIEAEIEREKNTVIWEIEVVDNQNQMYEFEIDANTGDILEKQLDND